MYVWMHVFHSQTVPNYLNMDHRPKHNVQNMKLGKAQMTLGLGMAFSMQCQEHDP